MLYFLRCMSADTFGVWRRTHPGCLPWPPGDICLSILVFPMWTYSFISLDKEIMQGSCGVNFTWNVRCCVGSLQALGFVHGAKIVHAPEAIHGRLRQGLEFCYMKNKPTRSGDSLLNSSYSNSWHVILTPLSEIEHDGCYLFNCIPSGRNSGFKVSVPLVPCANSPYAVPFRFRVQTTIYVCTVKGLLLTGSIFR